MDSNTRENLLNTIWGVIDITKKGFIYGRDLPKFIDTLLNCIDDTGSRKIDDGKLKLVNTFAKDQTFTKIYKVVLDEILNKLIGLTFEDITHDAVIIKTLEMPPSRDIKTNEVKTNNITDLRDELKRKDNIIQAKQVELEDMQRNTEMYKEKFDHLVKEFNYYKQSMENRNVPQQNATSASTRFDVKSEFFMDEFKRQISEQSKIINKLKEQIQFRPEMSKPVQSKSTSKNIFHNIPIFISRQFTTFLIIITILGLLSSLYFRLSYIEDIEFTTDESGSWLDDNSLFSKVTWFIREHGSGSDYQKVTSQNTDPLNLLFGDTGGNRK